MRYILLALLGGVLAAVLVACEPHTTAPPASTPATTFDKGDRLGLTFEERMAVRARLTVITAEAQAEANEIYDRYRSRDLAIRNETYADRLENEKLDALKEAHTLTDDDLDSIVDEYLYHQHVDRSRH
jgi:hypothetical protein